MIMYMIIFYFKRLLHTIYIPQKYTNKFTDVINSTLNNTQ